VEKTSPRYNELKEESVDHLEQVMSLSLPETNGLNGRGEGRIMLKNELAKLLDGWWKKGRPITEEGVKAILALVEKDRGTCEWKPDDPDGENDLWATGCGETFYLIDESPAKNGMKYCCFCGKPIKEVSLNRPWP